MRVVAALETTRSPRVAGFTGDRTALVTTLRRSARHPPVIGTVMVIMVKPLEETVISIQPPARH
jgi:hypothetical protein